jgi:hypothetical protein
MPDTALTIFQTYIADTPLIEGAALVSYSIFLGYQDNRVRPIDDLLTHGGLDHLAIQRAGRFDELIEHLISDAHDSPQL